MKKILVIGEEVEDVFVYGRCTRLAPDGPFPVFVPSHTKKNKGCAGNVVANIFYLCPEFEVRILRQEGEITKTRLVDMSSNYTLIRTDVGDSCKNISIDVLQKLVDEIPTFDAICISDYNKGFLRNEDIRFVLFQAFQKQIPTFLDTKKILGSWSIKASFVKINTLEYNNNINAGIKPEEFCQELIVTLGEDGARHRDKIYPTWKTEVKDQSGCGDSMMAGLIVNYLQTGNLEQAINYGNKVASVAVSKKGVVAVTRQEAMSVK